jgi:cell division protein FtsN
MKKLFFGILLLSIGFAGCKSKKMAPVERASQERAPIERETEIAVEATSDAQIRSVEERFTFTRNQDKDKHDQHQYFVIIGSFRNQNNAENYKQEMIAKGFVPVILLSETGLHRVSVNSYGQEFEARERIMQIRRSFPEHADTWLLIRR